jgi:osmotically-inducible protein OsmY
MRETLDCARGKPFAARNAEGSMKSPQLFCCLGVLAVLGAGCHQAPTRENVKQNAQAAADDIRTKGGEAKDRLADAWITAQVKSKLVGDREIRAGDIDVDTHDGVVTLKGKILNEPLRQLAVVLAQRTEGVARVVDQLQVQVAPPPDVQASRATPGAVATSGSAEATAPVANSNDTQITTTIQSKFFQDDRVKGRHINVASRNGVVTLNGEVADESERAQALLLARAVEGVTRVEDNLTVVSSAAPTPVTTPDTDDALRARVQSQLSSDSQFTAAPIEVSAKNGVVLLQGTVSTAAAKQRALTLARGTDGVTQVIDRVQVGRAKK